MDRAQRLRTDIHLAGEVIRSLIDLAPEGERRQLRIEVREAIEAMLDDLFPKPWS